MNARTTNTLIWTARGLFSTLAAIRAPCSVKARGRTRENFSRPRWSQFVTTSVFSTLVRKKAEPSGKRSGLRFTAWLRALVVTPYKAARSASRMTFSPRTSMIRRPSYSSDPAVLGRSRPSRGRIGFGSGLDQNLEGLAEVGRVSQRLQLAEARRSRLAKRCIGRPGFLGDADEELFLRNQGFRP